MQGVLYAYYVDGVADVTYFKELNSSCTETGSEIQIPYFWRGEYGFYDGDNLWFGDGNDLYKFSYDFQTHTSHQLSRSVDFSFPYNGKLYSTIMQTDLYIHSFYDPYSFYAESNNFILNNTAPPEFLTLPSLTTNEDTPVNNAILLSDIVTDTDTPFEELVFILKNVGDGIMPEYFSETSSINLYVIENWYGTSSFKIEVSDDYNSSEVLIEVTINPVNDPPQLLIDEIQMVEDQSWSSVYQDIYFDVDNNYNEVSIRSRRTIRRGV